MWYFSGTAALSKLSQNILLGSDVSSCEALLKHTSCWEDCVHYNYSYLFHRHCCFFSRANYMYFEISWLLGRFQVESNKNTENWWRLLKFITNSVSSFGYLNEITVAKFQYCRFLIWRDTRLRNCIFWSNFFPERDFFESDNYWKI